MDPRGFRFWWFSWSQYLPAFSQAPLWLQHTALILLVPPATSFLIGLAIAWMFGFLELYTCVDCSWPIYIAIFGLAYYNFCMLFLISPYTERLMELWPVLNTTRSELRAILNKYMEKMFLKWPNFLLALAINAIFIGAGAYFWGQPNLNTLIESNPSLKFIEFMPDERWYTSPIWAKFGVLAFFGIFILSDVAIALRGIIINSLLIKNVAKIRLASPYLLKPAAIKFRQTIEHTFLLSMNYSVGVWLFVAVSFKGFSTWVETSTIILLAISTFAIFAVPLFFLQRSLYKSKKQLLEKVLDAYINDNRVGQACTVKEITTPELSKNLQTMHLYNEILDSIRLMPNWLYIATPFINAGITVGIAILKTTPFGST